jgi:hypothetical protein
MDRQLGAGPILRGMRGIFRHNPALITDNSISTRIWRHDDTSTDAPRSHLDVPQHFILREPAISPFYSDAGTI